MKSKSKIISAIGFDNDTLYEQALSLSQHLHLSIDNQVLPRLQVQEDKLVLLFEQFMPLYVDFTDQTNKKRHQTGKNQGLVRACMPKPGLHILDATAGWGRDAAILASFGADVLMLEREPIMVALLTDGLRRLVEENLKYKLSLIAMDASQYLEALTPEKYPDVIYIDPMHPERKKSALVKKDMQALQQLITANQNDEALLRLALMRAKNRVVLKWPQRLPPLLKPDFSFAGKTVRFDVYLPFTRDAHELSNP